MGVGTVEDARINRHGWDVRSEQYQERHAGGLDPSDAGWGVWQLPERELRVLGDLEGKDVLELGCGGGHWSAWAGRQGGRVVALDLSARQLEHAARTVEGSGSQVRLVQGDGACLPLRDETFDVVFSDHGAFTFTDPHRSIPEAARVLRRGGLLAFDITTPLLELCWDSDARRAGPVLRCDYFGMGRLEWEDEVTYQLAYGDWIRLFRSCGLGIEDLIELRPPEGARTTFEEYVDYEWARRWPAEHIWRLRKIGGQQ